MALQVWLPLNGNLNNQGLNNITASGGTIDNNGKLGKCYLVNKNSYISIVHTIPKTSNWTMTWWMKLPSSMNNATAWEGMLNLNVVNSSSGADSSSTINWANYHNVKIWDDANHQWKWAAPGTDFNYDKWHYWTLVHSANGTGVQCNMYIDGQSIGNFSNTTHPLQIIPGTINIGFGISTGGFYINDFRIYDHVLSAKEIELLARGLVMHYPLNDSSIESTTNLVTSITAGGQTTVSGNSVTTSGTNADTYFQLNLSESIVNGTQYTISCDVEGMYEGEAWNFPLGSQGNTSLSWYLKNGHNEFPFIANDINWGTNRCFMDDAGGRVTRPITFSHFQIEKKDHATDYIDMGKTRNSTLVYDSSGYNYNGTATSNITCSTDSSRYDLSTVFNENGDNITPPSVWVENTLLNQLSVSIWFKTNTLNSTYPNFWSLGENYFARLRLTNATSAWYYLNINGTNVSSTYTIKNVLDNKWHHIVFTFENGVAKVFLDNTLVGTTDHSSTGTTLKMGNTNWYLAGFYATGEKFIGSLSDFRIYATALSTKAIQELYQMGASATKNGNLLTYEFKEY